MALRIPDAPRTGLVGGFLLVEDEPVSPSDIKVNRPPDKRQAVMHKTHHKSHCNKHFLSVTSEIEST